MKKKTMLCCGAALLGAALLTFTGLLASQQSLADKLIRFHVVADSDSPRDQDLKLQVRDALLQELMPLSSQADSREDMIALVRKALPSLKKTAEQTLQAQGCQDQVAVRLAEEAFPTRYYDTFALPAGNYLSLRVELGSAQGHNWWCVCFPTLCRSACTQELEAVATGAGFTQQEVEWMTEPEHYVIRFKLLEWWEALTKGK